MSEPYNRSAFHSKRIYGEHEQEQRDGDIFISNIANLTHVWTDSLLGFKNPKWRNQITAGTNATTPMTGYEAKVTSADYIAEVFLTKRNLPFGPDDWVYGSTVGRFAFSPFTKSTVSSISEVLANNEALANYVRAINRQQRTLQGAVVAGEFREVIRMIKSPGQALRGGMSAYLEAVKKRFRRGRPLPRRKKLREREIQKSISGLWLEYSFGWLPFLNDIDDGIRAIAESGVLSRDFRRPVQGVGKEESVIFDNPYQIGTSWPIIRGRRVRKTTCTVIYRGSVDSGSYRAYSPRRVGFAPQDWVPALWELLPWSFLIDYFTNIGEIISAASLSTSSLAWSNKTVIKEYHESFIGNDVTSTFQDSAYMTRALGGFIGKQPSSTSKTVTRSSYFGSLVPTLTFSTPGSSLRWLNIAALGTQSKAVGKFLSRLLT